MEITPIFYGISVLFVVIAAAYFAWASRAIGRTQALTQLIQLTDVVKGAVQQADSFYQMTDAQKYNFVSEQASLWLALRKVDVPPEVLRQIIEGAVELVHRARENSAPTTYKDIGETNPDGTFRRMGGG